MTKDEALAALEDGEKITHEFFTSNEFIQKGTVHDLMFEDGCECSFAEFWHYRSESWWDDNWSIFKEGART